MKVCDFNCFTDFYISFIISVVIGLLYDFFKCTGWKRYITDSVFALSGAVLFFCVWIYVLGGSLRWYVFLTVISGLFLYFLTVSRYISKILLFFNKKSEKFFKFIFKILLTHMQFLGKIIVCISGKVFVYKHKRGNCNEKD